jgi:energy-converting hydrogenase Eha subunit G
VSDRGSLKTTVLLIGMASGVFAGFGPALFTIDRKAVSVERIRWAEIAGAAITVAMGWALAHEERSTKPLVASVLISAAYVTGYEFMIRNPSSRAAI